VINDQLLSFSKEETNARGDYLTSGKDFTLILMWI